MTTLTGELRIDGDVPVSTTHPLVISGGAGDKVQFGKGVTLCGPTRIRFRGGGGTLLIGDHVQLRGHFDLGDGSIIAIGGRSKINRHCTFIALEGAGIALGKRCLLSNSTLRTCDMHSVLDAGGNRINPSRSITLEDRVWLAENTYITKGVRIGHDTVIAANSVVTKSIPAHAIAAGHPARVVREGIHWHRKRLPISTEAEGDGSERS